MLFLYRALRPKTLSVAQKNLSKTIYQGVRGTNELKIRTMTFPELDQTRSTWAKQEGWPSLKGGMPSTYQLDPNGFYLLERDGEKMASISMVSYPNIQFGYIGFFIVPKPLRKQGWGNLLFTEALNYTEKTRGIRTFGLNCTESMSPMYHRWGFQTVGLDHIWTFTAKSSPIQNPAYQEIQADQLSPESSLFQNLVRYDTSVFGTPRANYLRHFLNKAGTTTAVLKDNEGIAGYGVISEREPAVEEPHLSYRVGPLYAKNPKIAEEILEALRSTLQEKQSAYLETSENHPNATALVTMFDFKRVAVMHKMYRGKEIKQDQRQTYCYSSLVTGG